MSSGSHEIPNELSVGLVFRVELEFADCQKVASRLACSSLLIMEWRMKLTLLAGAIALCAAGAAFATTPTYMPPTTPIAATFETPDTNGDGRISATEARAHKELDAGYRDAVSGSEKDMPQAEFDTWVRSQMPVPPGS